MAETTKRRFRITRLEERIAPTSPGGGCGSHGGHGSKDSKGHHGSKDSKGHHSSKGRHSSKGGHHSKGHDHDNCKH